LLILVAKQMSYAWVAQAQDFFLEGGGRTLLYSKEESWTKKDGKRVPQYSHYNHTVVENHGADRRRGAVDGARVPRHRPGYHSGQENIRLK
jgi:hypothetical protein